MLFDLLNKESVVESAQPPEDQPFSVFTAVVRENPDERE